MKRGPVILSVVVLSLITLVIATYNKSKNVVEAYRLLAFEEPHIYYMDAVKNANENFRVFDDNASIKRFSKASAELEKHSSDLRQRVRVYESYLLEDYTYTQASAFFKDNVKIDPSTEQLLRDALIEYDSAVNACLKELYYPNLEYYKRLYVEEVANIKDFEDQLPSPRPREKTHPFRINLFRDTVITVPLLVYKETDPEYQWRNRYYYKDYLDNYLAFIQEKIDLPHALEVESLLLDLRSLTDHSSLIVGSLTYTFGSRVDTPADIFMLTNAIELKKAQIDQALHTACLKITSL